MIRSTLRTTILAVCLFSTLQPAVVLASTEPFDVDFERSSIVAILRKAGFFMFRFLGHEHGIIPNDWAAQIDFDETNLEASSVSVALQVTSFVIDSEEARRLAEIDEDGPSEEEVRGIHEKMLSNEQLGAEEYPEILFKTTSIRRTGDDELVLSGPLMIHGISRNISVPARLTRTENGFLVAGEFKIKQTDYGIEPVSVAGVVKVADELDVRFEIYATRRQSP